MSNTLCSFPFVHTDIEPNGDIKFCCAAVNGEHKDASGQVYNIMTHTLKDAWNSKQLKQTRLEMIAGGKPEICSYCWMMENEDNTKGASVRLQAANRRAPIESIQDRIDYARTHNGELSDDHLAYDFQLSIGNLCNLACKMCNPGYSTQYQKFFRKIYDKPQDVKFVKNAVTTNDEVGFNTTFDWPITQSLPEIFKDHTSSLQRIFFTGGEPTLIPEVLDFIDYLSSNPNITIWPSTNCTNINKRLLDSMEKFNEVWLNLSLDGMDEVAYIQRTPSNWASIEKNVDMLMDWVSKQDKEIRVNVITTLTALNFHQVLDFWSYFSNRYSNKSRFGLAINLVKGSHTNFSIDIVPQLVADKIKKQFDVYKQNVPENLEYSVEYMEDIFATTKFADSHESIHFCLDELQRCHLDKNIRDIYSIYYK